MGNIDTDKYMPAHASFDPGDDSKPSTGITLWSHLGKVLLTNEISVESLNEVLDWFEEIGGLYSIIVEEFMLYQHKALQQSGSKLPPVQIIGMIKRSAYKQNIVITEVRADCKSIAAAWSQTKIPSGHMPNWMASYLVGYYHLHKIGIIPAKVLETS